jgi:hypothetical protein
MDVIMRADHRAAMAARFPCFERLFNYEDSTGRILSANAGFRFNGRGPREIRDFIHFAQDTREAKANVERFCDLEDFMWAVGAVAEVARTCECDMCR